MKKERHKARGHIQLSSELSNDYGKGARWIGSEKWPLSGSHGGYVNGVTVLRYPLAIPLRSQTIYRTPFNNSLASHRAQSQHPVN